MRRGDPTAHRPPRTTPAPCLSFPTCGTAPSLEAACSQPELGTRRGARGVPAGLGWAMSHTHAPPPNLWQRDGQPHARGLPDVSPWVDAGADGDRARGRSQPRCLPPAATQTRLINHRLWPPHTPGSARAGSGPALSGCSHPRARKVCPPPQSETAPPSLSPPCIHMGTHKPPSPCMGHARSR